MSVFNTMKPLKKLLVQQRAEHKRKQWLNAKLKELSMK